MMAMQKVHFFNSVIPVPDQVRHDGFGIEVNSRLSQEPRFRVKLRNDDFLHGHQGMTAFCNRIRK